MSEGLKPCPFCGSIDIELYELSEDGNAYARCLGCGAEGSVQGTLYNAIDSWNRRAIDVDALCEIADELECDYRPKDYASVDALCELSNDASKALAKRIREVVGLEV